MWINFRVDRISRFRDFFTFREDFIESQFSQYCMKTKEFGQQCKNKSTRQKVLLVVPCELINPCEFFLRSLFTKINPRNVSQSKIPHKLAWGCAVVKVPFFQVFIHGNV